MVLCNPKQQIISLEAYRCLTCQKIPSISSILRPLLFLIYINNLPKLLIWNAILIIFTDDSSAVTTNSNIVDFQSNIKAVFEHLNNWFNLHLLPLNFDQTNFINFRTQKYS